jgi:23S rRNA (cytidine1920-2'-O)/16S rRNA (cytidine1409-2'-O)-methyltransferase
MVRRGMARSRAEAAMAIRAGKVTVAGRPAAKAAALVQVDEPIDVAAPGRRFASRGGEKLDAALDRFRLDVTSRRCLDAGASTGGFTDCLLRRGAAHVIAVDVGYGQLDWRLRDDPRVTVLERTNVRTLDPGALPYRAELVTADLSFISLALVLPVLARAATEDATFVLLVKPQFEAGREHIAGGGVVRDAGAWRTSVERIAAAAATTDLRVLDVTASPLLGPAGNAEFFLLAGPGAQPAGFPVDLRLDAAIAEATNLVRRKTEGTRA